MESSQAPFAFDQQGLVALFRLPTQRNRDAERARPVLDDARAATRQGL